MHSPTTVLVNPAAGGGRALRSAQALRGILTDGGLDCRLVISRGRGDLARAAADAARAGEDFVIAFGGDGTLSEVASGLLDVGGETALAPIPVGTGNDFVKTAGIPRDWRAAARRVVTRPDPRRVDAGRVNGRWFINGVGMGLDAAVAIGADRHKRRVGVLGYLAGFAETLRRGPVCPRAHLSWDSGADERPVSLVSVSNGSHVGGLFHIAPGARLDDGELRLVWADAIGRCDVLRYAPRVIRGTHLSLPIVHTAAVRHVTVEVDAPLPVQADGEIIDSGATRLDVEIVPGALRLVG